MGGSPWTIRDFQIKLERQLHQTVMGLTCNSNKKTPLNECSVKWLASYAYEATDPDQELRRFEEYLNSRKLAQELIQKVPVVADERAGKQAAKNHFSPAELRGHARLEQARSVWLIWFVLFIWFIWFIRLVWFNQINKTNQTNQ